MSTQAVSSQPQVWSGASGSSGTNRSPKLSNLFDKIDTSGSGSITKAQLEDAMKTMKLPGLQGMTADQIFAKLDPNGTGSVSKQDFVSGMQSMIQQAHQGGGHHHHHEDSSAVQAPSTNGSGSQVDLSA